MLLELLEGTDGGFVIIRDSVSYSGRHLLKSYISAALKREEDVHVLGFDASQEELQAGLDNNCKRRLFFHDGYTDPVGWTKRSGFTVHQFTIPEMTSLLGRVQQPGATTLVIDSLSWVLRHHDPLLICQRIQELKRRGAVRTILGLLHSDMHQRGVVESLCHLATSVIAVAPGARGLGAVAKTTRRSKSGRVTQEEVSFRIQEDLRVVVQSRASRPGQAVREWEDQEPDPTANLTFNLRLSEVEREAREKLALPFVFSQAKKSALLNPGHGTGRILYEPDANDDFDQEDPDDDLDV